MALVRRVVRERLRKCFVTNSFVHITLINLVKDLPRSKMVMASSLRGTSRLAAAWEAAWSDVEGVEVPDKDEVAFAVAVLL